MVLTRGFLIALFVIFALLAIPLKSYLQPLIVMSAVPFGLVGAVIGHVVFGVTLNFMSMMGMVAVAGVVVNDSLVLVHFINRGISKHGSLIDAVVQAGSARFRPILLTSLTTTAGVTPLMLETSLQAQFMIPDGCGDGFRSSVCYHDHLASGAIGLPDPGRCQEPLWSSEPLRTRTGAIKCSTLIASSALDNGE